ncbi:MAG: hypothetical protein EBT63_05055 [Proteobacteria bacterium]|nr:hypothetical protein [Pseudomonadota bacterium]NCA27930.1 hypothetical protein [Pseudomonadota bacterium]
MAEFNDSSKKLLDLSKNNNISSPNSDEGSPNFINQQNQANQQNSCDENLTQETKNLKEKLDSKDKKKLDDLIESLKNSQVRPINNQQRNLDREDGGLEQENIESQAHIIDEWDNRGEEIIEMGKHNPINKSSGKKSMLWNLIRKRFQQKKINEELENLSDDLKKVKVQDEQKGSDFDSRKKQSLTQRFQALKEDRTDFKPPSKIR